MAASTQSAETTRSAPIIAEIKGGHLDWRPAEAFAGGERDGLPSVTVAGGAAERRDGTVRFQSAKGFYNARTDVVTAAYRGAVVLTYTGSRVTLANPTVVIGPAGSALRLNVDVRSTDAAQTAAKGEEVEQAEIGDLQTFGIAPETAQRTVTWTEVPATLTAAGADALPGEEFEGVELGPMTVVVTLAKNLAPADQPGRRAAEVGAAATTPAAPGGPPAAAEESPCPSPTGTAPTPTTTDTTPPPTSPAPSESVSPPVDECSPSPGPDDLGDGSSGGSALSNGSSGDAGSGDSLAKTGSALIPLMVLGGGMTVAGGGLMLTARRRAFTAQA